MGRDRSAAGISNLGMILSLAGVLIVLLIVAIVVSVTLPKNSATSDTIGTGTTATTVTTGGGAATSTTHGPITAPTTTTTSAGLSGIPSAAESASCRSDVSDVQTALAAYQASNGAYPTPPAAWTAADYPTNFAPLTNPSPPGPFLKMPPGDNHYVILWDATGRIWVEPVGNFTPTYDAANDGANPSTCARVAR